MIEQKDCMKLKKHILFLILIPVAVFFLSNCHRFRVGKQFKAQPTIQLEGKIALVHENHLVKRYGFVDEKIFLKEFEEELKGEKGIELVSFRESRKRIQDAKLDSDLVKINLHDPVALKANPAVLAKLASALGTDNVIVVYSDEDAFPKSDSFMYFGSGAVISTSVGHGRGIFHSISLIQLKSADLIFQEFISSEDSPVNGPGRGRKLASILVDGLLSAKAAN
ncbi:hypothetical protein EHQ83_18690 [Leptospira yasudae]|uniref:Lipoprotein n=2 Tax=Leptospira yasudae TaxID=2202201 RepID=A0A6N4QJX9_9LEPT|nr:hypothetical protein EHQ77_19370 [Leptospira yasudae]TGL79267.1 hypothetical protein EHQ83_18690 [Leptospira yasudae]TGL82954.1 hypothetical protein EHQ72_03265 [Leptospira yasudae]